ncbi:ferredoxin [Streptomyces sp. NPDC048057]|uniref:ferredoxin n=1 Tax=Streptomyces sp. NPDC048057 TaxID=3155628 RepID=UPI0033E156B4
MTTAGEKTDGMRITVDLDRCEGYGLCEAEAPELLLLDDGHANVLVAGDVPEDQREAALSAVHTCPIAALRFT